MAAVGRFGGRLLKTSAPGGINLVRCLGTTRGYVPRRSLLYIPGNDERKVRKATGLKADCVVLDCEDGVAFNRKVRLLTRGLSAVILINIYPQACASLKRSQIFFQGNEARVVWGIPWL